MKKDLDKNVVANYLDRFNWVKPCLWVGNIFWKEDHFAIKTSYWRRQLVHDLWKHFLRSCELQRIRSTNTEIHTKVRFSVSLPHWDLSTCNVCSEWKWSNKQIIKYWSVGVCDEQVRIWSQSPSASLKNLSTQLVQTFIWTDGWADKIPHPQHALSLFHLTNIISKWLILILIIVVNNISSSIVFLPHFSIYISFVHLPKQVPCSHSLLSVTHEWCPETTAWESLLLYYITDMRSHIQYLNLVSWFLTCNNWVTVVSNLWNSET